MLVGLLQPFVSYFEDSERATTWLRASPLPSTFVSLLKLHSRRVILTWRITKGFATGPLIWAPLSELRGRKIPLVLAMFGFSIFSVGSAVGKDLQTVLICRFFGGVFASCPLAVVAAVFSDVGIPQLLVFKSKEAGAPET